jgi:hypothetical protein
VDGDVAFISKFLVSKPLAVSAEKFAFARPGVGDLDTND